MIWNEGMIARAIATQTLARRCLVLVDRCQWTGHECDVLGVTKDLRIIDVEIKISRGDLKVDARKQKWWHRQFGTSRPHPPRVWKHYYAMPAEIWIDELVAALPSAASGVLLMHDVRGNAVARCWRRATPCRDAYRLTSSQVIDIARLANLRMWEAYGGQSARRPA